MKERITGVIIGVIFAGLIIGTAVTLSWPSPAADPIDADRVKQMEASHPLLDGLEGDERKEVAEWLRHRDEQCYLHCHLMGGKMQGVTRFGCVCDWTGYRPESYPDRPLELPYSIM